MIVRPHAQYCYDKTVMTNDSLWNCVAHFIKLIIVVRSELMLLDMLSPITSSHGLIQKT